MLKVEILNIFWLLGPTFNTVTENDSENETLDTSHNAFLLIFVIGNMTYHGKYPR